MLIIYHGLIRSKSVVSAARIHLAENNAENLLNKNRHFNLCSSDPTNLQPGIIHPLGIDGRGWQVCVLFRGRRPSVLLRVLQEIGKTIGLGPSEMIFVNMDGYEKGHWVDSILSFLRLQNKYCGEIDQFKLEKFIQSSKEEIGSNRPTKKKVEPRKIIYCCYGSAHSSVTAAAIHLNRLPWDRLPTFQEILMQPHFDRIKNEQIGTLFFIGEDRWGNEVYTLGLGTERRLIHKAIYSLLQVCDYPAEEIRLIDSLGYIHPLTRVGGFLSRRIGLVAIGRPLVLLGIRLSYSQLLKIVKVSCNDLLPGEKGP